MDVDKQKISVSLQSWRHSTKGKSAVFFIQVVVPVLMSTGLSVYYSANMPSGKDWFNAIAIGLVFILIWTFSYRKIESFYQKYNETSLVNTIELLIKDKNDEISELDSEISDLQEKLVVEMARNGTLERVSNGRIRKISNYYEAGIHDPFNFINSVLNENSDNGIDNVIEALTSFYYEVRFGAEYSDLDVPPSLRASLWVESNKENVIELISSKSYGNHAPTKKGCMIDVLSDRSKLQSLAWNDITPKAFLDAKKVDEACRSAPHGAPFELDSGWKYKIASACCIPVECPETAAKLGVLWIDTNVPEVFNGDSAFNLDEDQWSNEVAPLVGPFINRLAFYIWLRKCAVAIDSSINVKNT